MSDQSKHRRSWGKWQAIEAKAEYLTAMSAVWLVQSKSEGTLGEVCALKEMRYSKGPGSTGFQRFAREMEILGRLNHPGIIRMIDSFLPESDKAGAPYFVMPLASTSLERAAPSFAGNLELLVSLGKALVEALGSAHGEGVRHRDIKPGNILLFGDARVPVLADFGIGYLVDATRLTKTEAGTVGTEDYVAPELKGGEEVSNVHPSADVYSFGKTLYYAISGGTTLIREDPAIERFDLAKRFADPRMEHATAVLAKMVRFEAEERPQSMAECGALLRMLSDHLRSGTAFRPGLYDGSRAPIFVAKAFAGKLGSLQGVRRADLVQDAIEDAMREAAAAATEKGAVEGALSGQAFQRRPIAMTAAASAAESLLAVGIPLITENDTDSLEELLRRLEEWVGAKETADTLGERYLFPPTASVAVNLLAGYAWYRRRAGALALLVQAQLRQPQRWLHHYILGETATAVIPWAIEVGRASGVIAGLDPRWSQEFEPTIYGAAGLVLLRSLEGVTAEQIEYLIAHPEEKIVGESFTGYYQPTVEWTGILPRAFRLNPKFEAEVASRVFGVTVTDLRGVARNITPLLAASFKNVGSVLGHRTSWGLSGVGDGWEDWCGGRPK